MSLPVQTITNGLTFIQMYLMCILQDGRPAAFFSCKLLKSQQNYTVIEKEILSFVATLEEFQGMLYSADLHVFTDHINLMFDT